jgi:hypothetical protein
MSFDQIIFFKKICSPLWKKGLKMFPFWELTFSLFKKVKLLSLGGWLWVEPLWKVLICSLFKSVEREKKIEVFSEGKARKKFFASGFAFERLTFLSKIENRSKRGKNLCDSFTRKDILNFKECLGDGNLWFLPFSFHWLCSHVFFF